jgi:hypothetical protein
VRGAKRVKLRAFRSVARKRAGVKAGRVKVRVRVGRAVKRGARVRVAVKARGADRRFSVAERTLRAR